MRRAGIHPGLDEGIEDALEGLGLGKDGIFITKGGVEMGVDAADGQVVVVEVHRENLFRLMGHEAVAPHAGVHLHVYLRHGAPLAGQGVEGGGLGGAGDGGDDVQIQHLLELP